MKRARHPPVNTNAEHYNKVAQTQKGFTSVFKGLREYNNLQKRLIIEALAAHRPGVILDIGCGRGGDVQKWKHSAPAALYIGVDHAGGALAELETRAQQIGLAVKTYNAGIVAYFSNLRKAVSDVTVMMFCLNYFWNDRQLWLGDLCATTRSAIGIVFLDSEKCATLPRSVISDETETSYRFTLDGLVDCVEEKVALCDLQREFAQHGWTHMHTLQHNEKQLKSLTPYERKVCSAYSMCVFTRVTCCGAQ